MPEESAFVVALTLLRIFPAIESINYIGKDWVKVADAKDAICLSRRIVDHSSKEHPPPSRSIYGDAFLGAALKDGS